MENKKETSASVVSSDAHLHHVGGGDYHKSNGSSNITNTTSSSSTSTSHVSGRKRKGSEINEISTPGTTTTIGLTLHEHENHHQKEEEEQQQQQEREEEKIKEEEKQQQLLQQQEQQHIHSHPLQTTGSQSHTLHHQHQHLHQHQHHHQQQQQQQQEVFTQHEINLQSLANTSDTSIMLPSGGLLSSSVNLSHSTIVPAHSIIAPPPEGWMFGADKIAESKNRTQTLGGTVLSDIWRHFYISVCRTGTTKRNRAKCIYCHRELDGRVYRMMNHCESCPNIPPFEKEEVMRLKIASKAAQAAAAAASAASHHDSDAKDTPTSKSDRNKIIAKINKRVAIPPEYHEKAIFMQSIIKNMPRIHGFKRILVTGGAGFIGSALCRRLLEMGNEVVCVDNLYTSQRSSILPLLAQYPHLFEFIRYDIVEQYKCEVDEIYNLACPSSAIYYQSDPIKTTETLTIGTSNILRLAKKLHCRIFHASSSDVYGDPQLSPQSEDYLGNVNCTGIRSCYHEGKRLAESLCFDFHRYHSVDVRVARLFNTYGPGMNPNDGMVISNFIMQALQDRDITVYGDGSQVRSFCFIDDMIDGMILFMENKENFVGPINLGHPRAIHILELAKMIVQLTGSQSKIIFTDFPSDDSRCRQPDVRLAQTKLNWEARTNLEEGLQKTIDYFRSIGLCEFNAQIAAGTNVSQRGCGSEIKMKQDI